MGERDRMSADDWEANRGVPDFLADGERSVAPIPRTQDNKLLVQLLATQQQLLKEQRETNRMLSKIGVMLQGALSRPRQQAPQSQQPKTPGVPTDLDSEKGNFRVNKNPPKWQGADFSGRLLSECSPEFLDELAKFYEWRVWRAQQDLEKTPGDEKAQKSLKYVPMDIARIKGWAQRLRNGYGGTAPTAVPGTVEQQEPSVPMLG